MIRIAAMLTLALGLAACSEATKDLAGPTEPLGDFKLGHAEVVAPAPKQLLVSRSATSEEWVATVDRAFEERFRRFEGGRFYHLGIKVEAYSLPPPVVPGKSAVQLLVSVWDDAAQAKMTTEPHVINVIQIFETRLNLTRAQQMQRLAEVGALEAEKWLRAQQAEEGWFGGLPAGAATGPAGAPAAEPASDPGPGGAAPATAVR
jgi:hypothetical protein